MLLDHVEFIENHLPRCKHYNCTFAGSFSFRNTNIELLNSEVDVFQLESLAFIFGAFYLGQQQPSELLYDRVSLHINHVII